MAAEEAARDWMTVAEVAETLRVSERFVRKLIADGRLPVVKVGVRVVRVRRSDLNQVFRPARVPTQRGGPG